MAIANSSGLGYFVLGAAKLGTAPKQMAIFESLGIADELELDIEILINEGIGFADTITEVGHAIYIEDTLGIVDSGSYKSDYMAGVYAKITVILDVTSDDFCEIVLESGQTISVNGTPARAFCFVKQTGQKFDHGVNIQAGDAVLFSCPTSPIIEVEDIIGFHVYEFKIISIIDHFFDGNLVYRKAGLRRLSGDSSLVTDLPGIIGLIASENLKGKTALTWDDIDKIYYPELDYYQVWESATGGSGTAPISGFTATGPGIALIDLSEAYSAGKYTAGGLIVMQGSEGNDGDYLITSYQDNGGQGQLAITVTEAFDITAPLGTVFNATMFYMRDETKSNGLSVKNITANTVYYYLVRAIDKYGGAGEFSNEAVTPVNQTAPAAPTGVRNG